MMSGLERGDGVDSFERSTTNRSLVYGQTASTLWGPTQITVPPKAATIGEDANQTCSSLEVSIHTLPKPLQREFHHVFDDRNLPFDALNQLNDDGAEILAILTNQHAREDLVAVGDHVELEKDRLLNTFMDFARSFCQNIRSEGFWADFIDPCSGLPMLTENCNKVYSEVDGMECCLGYKSFNAGFCKVLTHPKWGSAVYPATIFAYAPRHLLLHLLQSL